MITQKKDLRTGHPFWLSLPVHKIPHRKLLADQKTDIVIIGAGITGVMAAEELSAAGFKIILLDRRGPLKGATSATTALLQYEIDNPLINLQKRIGNNNAMRAWRRSKLGLDSLAAKLQSLGIKCGARNRPTLYLAGDVLDAAGLKEEWQARNAIGLHTDYHTRKSLYERYGIKRSAALQSFDSLAVNPIQMATGFLSRAIKNGTEVYAPVTADQVEAGYNGVAIHTGDGPVIRACYLIYATGYEIPKTITSRRFKLHSTYAITTRRQPGKLWPGQCLIWEAADPYLYIRTTADGRVICGGEDEEFENEEKRDALIAKKTVTLEKKLSAIFPHLNSKAEFAWCGSFGASDTGLPFIGEIPGMGNCFAILAFGGNGITFSRIAAELLLSHLTGGHDPDADLFAFS